MIFSAICSPPCLNGGKCVRPPNTCRCLPNFTGKYCELKSHRNKKKTIIGLDQSNHILKKSKLNKIKRKRQKKRRKLKIKDLTNQSNPL